MDIGKIVEIGERKVEGWKPAPTMVPVEPEKDVRPEPEEVKERETA
jgi:hypothetical protein